MSSSRSSSTTAGRKAALVKFKEARRKRDLGEDDDRFGNIKEEEDVYDIVEETEYQSLVESRRQREDFVVDDDGLGYYDDGEERLGDEEGLQEKHAKKRNSTAALTSASLKKARKAKAALQASGSANANAAGEDQDVAAGNRSMWEFVQRGSSAKTSSSSGAPSSKQAAAAASSRNVNVDSLLEQLDDVTASASVGRSARTAGNKSKGGARRQIFQGAGRRGRSPMPPPPRRRSSVSRRQEEEEQPRKQKQPRHDDEQDEPDDADFAGFEDHDNYNDNDNDDHDDDMQIDDYSPTKNINSKELVAATPEFKPKDGEEERTPSHKVRFAEDTETETKPELVTPISTELKQPEATAPVDVPAPRRLARPKLGRRSAPAQKAVEEQQAKQQQQHAQPSPQTPKSAPILVDTSSVSFKPDDIAAESSAPTNPEAATNLESFVETQEEDRHIDFYWMDATERKGDIFLYGKVASQQDKTKFVSCCAVVKGNLRNLFVLPRKNEEGDYVDMMQVHQELKNILQPSCIPLVAGASWAGKVVDRQYAFDDPELPREKTQYLKVVYDAKFPAPPQDVCHQGSQAIHKILNAGASNLETFILKRKLNGPCWIRIRDPQANTRGVVSWCALELQIDTPKNIQRLDLAVPLGTSPRPPPPVVTVTLKLKTVVNPQTHKNEIVSVSAVCHKQVLLDTASDESPRYMTQLSLIRPIHVEDSSNTQGMAKFPRDFEAHVQNKMPKLQSMPNERALLSRLVTQIGVWDPDVLVGHNAWGHDMQVILSRCVEHKVKIWSKMGRQRKMELPNKSYFSSGKDWAIADALTGRLLCDTYLSAKEHLRETTYSLKNLAETQLKTSRQEIEPMDIPQYFQSSQTIVALALHTLNDAQLVQRLMFKLQILPLSKQLTCIAGNLWSSTLKSNRAARTEYLLLHEFHRLKYLAPEKSRGKKEEVSGKAKYLGGLVLEPKKGLYDSFILLLDFNSLYPSIIQEYNLCFTTVDEWSRFAQQQPPPQHHEEGEQQDALGELPPIPDETAKPGVLPRVIKSLVDRRRTVKQLLKKEKNAEAREELDVRQKALKLTANSMYGCLGYSHSRFFAQPIAALVTAKGRETLQKTVDIAQSQLGLDVIYGDTDSIMINTRITDKNAIKTVRELGEQVKREVNKLYRTLELEIDGIFQSMLLLKKKKYAAITVEEGANGELKYQREEKGLDLVRRDWCIQSKDSGRYILDNILSSQDKEETVSNIFTHLDELAKKMRSGEIPLEKYVITKGLSKHPNDYPDGKSQPHVHVAKMMIKNNHRLTVGDHIPYVITEPLGEEDPNRKVSKSSAERARHPDEIARSNGILKPDVEWYLTQQILPPVSRLCEPIEGISQGLLAERLGLDSKRYSQQNSGGGEINDDELVDYTPASCMTDADRFKDVKKLCLMCSACGVESEFPGVLRPLKEDGKDIGIVTGGLQCVNPQCTHPKYWGEASYFDCMSRIMNATSVLINGQIQDYYRGTIKCDDPLCALETRQLSVVGGVCLRRGCNGQMHSKFNERSLHTQLKYLECLFDRHHACEQLERKNLYGTKSDLLKSIPKADQAVYDELHQNARKFVEGSAFNWISPSFWQSMFGDIRAKQ